MGRYHISQCTIGIDDTHGKFDRMYEYHLERSGKRCMINRSIWERRWRFCDLLHSCFGRWLGRSSSHFGPCIKSVSDYLVRIYAARFVCIVMKRNSTSNEPLQLLLCIQSHAHALLRRWSVPYESSFWAARNRLQVSPYILSSLSCPFNRNLGFAFCTTSSIAMV